MASLHETAYPRLKADLGPPELAAIFTPTMDELAFAAEHTQASSIARLGLLLHLKLFQRLGYFLPIPDIPLPIRRHIGEATGFRQLPSTATFNRYEASGTKRRHVQILRAYLGVRPLEVESMGWLRGIADAAAETKEAVADIINVMLEELVRARYELPAFSTLHRLAQQARAGANDRFFEILTAGLGKEAMRLIDELLHAPVVGSHSSWNALKQEPRRPTNAAVRAYLHHVRWIESLTRSLPPLSAIPAAKRQQFLLEARALTVGQMQKLKPRKRYALAVLFIRAQRGKAMDDVVDLLIRLVRSLDNSAQQRLEQHRLEQGQRVDTLVAQLKSILDALHDEGAPTQRLEAIQAALSADIETLLTQCDEHLAYAGNNALPFMLTPYREKRALLFNCLDILPLQVTSEDASTERWIERLKAVRQCRQQRVTFETIGIATADKLGWLPERWRRMILGSRNKKTPSERTVDRRYFELALFAVIKRELSSGDLYVEHGDRYDDYREQLVDRETFTAQLAAYCETVELPAEPSSFRHHLQEWLTQISREVDQGFASNAHASIVDGRLVMKRPKAAEVPPELRRLDLEISQRLPPTSIVDALIDTERWLDLHRLCRPLSGNASRLEDARTRFIATLFCFGCNLGPTQTARSVKEFNRRQVAWLDLQQVTEERLDQAIVAVINAYNKFELPGYWGSGKHASADGTKWDVYEQNLLSEYHIRYGGYGGIGYYHVSDTYIALFSHFIPCGVHEAIYILDGLMANTSDIQPDTLHGDTHAQSYPVFGLAYLLGIQLMPRIRGIKDLMFFRADKEDTFTNIDALFGEAINLQLVESSVHDMLRVAASIRMGKITASAILRRLGTYSRKNKLYFAFRELGKVVRTGYLLRYISDVDLRRTVHSATNKSEEFNHFAKWSFFGDEGIIAENIRHEQRKILKYNHLVANMLILHNVEHMSRVLRALRREGMAITPELLAGTSPYRTIHYNRFGDYTIDVSRAVEPLSYKLSIL